jgi:acyl dehydratase
MADKLVTDEIKRRIGLQSEPFVVEVERGAIRRFAEAIGDPNPVFNDEKAARKSRFGTMIAPPTFCRSLGAVPLLREIGLGTHRILDGGSEWEYFEPIRPGDRITVVSRVADIREAKGRLGLMALVVVETTYTNQFGERCVTQRNTSIHY